MTLGLPQTKSAGPDKLPGRISVLVFYFYWLNRYQGFLRASPEYSPSTVPIHKRKGFSFSTIKGNPSPKLARSLLPLSWTGFSPSKVIRQILVFGKVRART